MTINPDTLKKLRGSLSQEGLAEKAQVSRKTISNIESGKSTKPNSITEERLAKALDTTPEKLALAPDNQEVVEATIRRLGYRKTSFLLDGDTALSFSLVQERYGISEKRQIEMAPLFTALLAELSLQKRKDDLQALEDALVSLESGLPNHLYFGNNETANVQAIFMDEHRSIAARDLFGKNIQQPDRESYHGPLGENPFFDFLIELAAKLDVEIGEDVYDLVDAGEDGLPEQFHLFNSEVKEICGDNDLALEALKGFVRLKDIPAELREKDMSSSLQEWLADRVPSERREEIEKYRALFDIGPDVQEERSTKPHNSEGGECSDA